MSGLDTKTVIEQAIARVMAELPALAPLKLVLGLDLRGRGDVQLYRVEMPGPGITKDAATDARVRLTIPRALLNEMADHGTIKEWRKAFEGGQVSAKGPSQLLRLIENVVARHEQRARTPKVR